MTVATISAPPVSAGPPFKTAMKRSSVPSVTVIGPPLIPRMMVGSVELDVRHPDDRDQDRKAKGGIESHGRIGQGEG
jgi:hypothetical protein